MPYPPNKGDKIRSFNEIRHFSKNHEIHLLAFCDSPDEQKYASELGQYCKHIELIPLRANCQKFKAMFSMINGKPWTLGYYDDARMHAAVKEMLHQEPIDLVFAYSSSMAPYALLAEKAPKVLDFVDSDAAKWRQYAKFKPAYCRWLYGYEADRLSVFENDMVQKCDRSVFVSPRETRHLSDPCNKISFIQNGIELNGTVASSPDRSNPKAIFVGAMDYYPNIDAVQYFALEVLPQIRKSRNIEFYIVGSNPAPAVKKLAGQPGVVVTGTVPDVAPYLQKASVAVVPTRIAQGIQNKILEALGSGLPVVASRAAAEGLHTLKGIPVRVADHPSDFARQVLDYLDHPISSQQIADSLDHLKRHYSWEANLSAFDQMFCQLRRV